MSRGHASLSLLSDCCTHVNCSLTPKGWQTRSCQTMQKPQISLFQRRTSLQAKTHVRQRRSGKPSSHEGTDAGAPAPPTATPAPGDVVVLTPSRLRIESRGMLAHATTQWLTTGIFCILLPQKVCRPLLSPACETSTMTPQ